MKGKKHGKYVLSVDGKRVGLEDGFGYTVLASFDYSPITRGMDLQDNCWCGNEVEILEDKDGLPVRGNCTGCNLPPAQCLCEK